jgi:glutathione S-transferase
VCALKLPGSTFTLAAMKSDKQTFPFGQAPAFIDDGLNILQSNAILRWVYT